MIKRVLGVALIVFPSVVLASVVIAESIEQMGRASTSVVVGTVGEVQAQLGDGGRRIDTYAEVRVTEVLKGPKVATVFVRSPGGKLGNRGTHVEGSPQFVTGQQAVLFLEPAPDEPGVWLTRGLAAGKVDLATSKGQLRALRHLEGIGFYEKGQIHPVTPEDDLGPAESFLARLRTAFKGGGK